MMKSQTTNKPLFKGLFQVSVALAEFRSVFLICMHPLYLPVCFVLYHHIHVMLVLTELLVKVRLGEGHHENHAPHFKLG